MKIEKSKNKYYVRKTINHKSYYLSFDTKPTKQDIQNEILKRLGNNHDTTATTRTLRQTIENYIKHRDNIYSPTTINWYYKSFNKIDKALLDTPVNKINNEMIQDFINRYAVNHSPKSCKNVLTNIITPIRYFEPTKIFNIKTPQPIRKQITLPTENEIELLKNYFKGTQFESVFLLSLYGLRQSEIFGLTIDDIDFKNGTISINKALVKNYKNEFVYKTTKTINSTRIIKINNYLLELIKKQGYITKKHYTQFRFAFKHAIKKLKINNLHLHLLRHNFASELHRLNIPTKYIQELGGWATDNVLKNIYTHTIESEKIKINDLINEKLFKEESNESIR